MTVLSDVFSRLKLRLSRHCPEIDVCFRIRRSTEGNPSFVEIARLAELSYAIDVTPTLGEQSTHRIEGVFAHALGHVVLLSRGDAHSEQDADRVAENLLDLTIAYDHEDVPTTRFGVRPRPFYMEQDVTKACLRD